MSRATASALEAGIGADPGRVGQLGEQRQKERARAGAEIGDPPDTRARAVRIDGGERRLDHRFGFRPRHQRRGIDAQRQAPEFLAADDARDRLARKPPRRERGDRRSLRGVKRAGAGRGERGMIEPKRVSDEDAGVELGRIEAGNAKFLRQCAPRFGDGAGTGALRAREGVGCARRHPPPSSAASSAAWCSAESASMISPSASPSRICGSL